MTNWMTAPFRFHGRITRMVWWFWFVVLMVLLGVGIYILQPTYFFIDGEAPGAAVLLWQLVLLPPSLAITKLRLNDRNWGSWVFWAFVAVSVPMYVLEFVYFGEDVFFVLLIDPFASTPVTSAQIAFTAYLLIFVAVVLPIAIDNGFMRGTPGDNRYGPDPNEATPS